MKQDWSWRVADREMNRELGLRYEPGGWGDLLKGVWAMEVARALVAGGASPLRFVDPFCGAIDYPSTAASEARAPAIEGSAFGALLSRFPGRWPSTAAAVRAAAAGDWEAWLYEGSGQRRSSWREVPGVRLLAVESGWEALRPELVGEPDLVLVDPYDAAGHRWTQEVLAGLASLRAAGAHVLLYVFNRAPRSPAALADYRAFRSRLEAALGPPWLLGRTPSDGLAPRAWHEVWLHAGRLPRVRLAPELRDRLDDATKTLARRILEPHVVEQGPGEP